MTLAVPAPPLAIGLPELPLTFAYRTPAVYFALPPAPQSDAATAALLPRAPLKLPPASPGAPQNWVSAFPQVGPSDAGSRLEPAAPIPSPPPPRPVVLGIWTLANRTLVFVYPQVAAAGCPWPPSSGLALVCPRAPPGAASLLTNRRLTPPPPPRLCVSDPASGFTRVRAALDVPGSLGLCRAASPRRASRGPRAGRGGRSLPGPFGWSRVWLPRSPGAVARAPARGQETSLKVPPAPSSGREGKSAHLPAPGLSTEPPLTD
ncbi:uncharacterized protein [Notamacropus eugenii]|uniref:uncharacterized protein n=1 Tax=Notamacropus eugenii TaxID=9315 RepID=UPI003B67CA04